MTSISSTLSRPSFPSTMTFGAYKGRRLERIQGSANFTNGRAVNLATTRVATAQGTGNTAWRYVTERQERVPGLALPVEKPSPEQFLPQGKKGLRVARFGHSTVFLEVDGHTILTDPVFVKRASPIQWAGPKRFHPAPLAVEQLPVPDVVLLSHDHYDHLDACSILTLATRGARFVMPLGVGARLEAWGVPESRITELDWWERTTVGGLELVCTPSRHFSGRSLSDSNRTLWSSWAIVGPHHRVWFSGDTGPLDALSEIGSALGPFDLTMIEIGAWDPAWGHVHLGPDGAAKVHKQVQGKVMLPIHWGTFNLALHAWYQPLVRLEAVAAEEDIGLLVPHFGQVVRGDSPGIGSFWEHMIAQQS